MLAVVLGEKVDWYLYGADGSREGMGVRSAIVLMMFSLQSSMC